VDDVRRLVNAHLPGYVVESVEALGEGQDNVAYEVNGELIVRLRKDGDHQSVDAEVRLLAVVAEVASLPVPEIVFSGVDCLAYRKLPGVPLLSVRGVDAELIGARLGGFLGALHGVSDRLRGVVQVDDQPLTEWRDEAAECYSTSVELVPAVYRAAVMRFLAAAPPVGDAELVFSHNDLGIEHVLVDPVSGAITGVIDWTDAAFCDPAYDFGLLLRDLGPGALDAALRAYGGDLRERAWFYARCSVFEDIAYGVPVYVDKSVASLAWLFAPIPDRNPGRSR
jgi:aminoglycoside phosphotransferase (APT) family kinase protein